MTQHNDQQPQAQFQFPRHSSKPAPRAPADREVPVVAPGHAADAFPAASRVPVAKPPHAEPPWRRAELDDIRARIERGDTTGALTRLDAVLTEDPDDVRLLCERATLLAGLSRFDRADADLRRAIKLDERNGAVLLAIGLLACKRARWRDALEPLREAIAIDPDLARAHYYLGEACNHVDDLTGALTAYARAAELDPSNWRSLQGMGVVLDRLGRVDEANASYRRARAARPT